MARVVTTTTAVKTAAAVSEVMCACLSARARAGGWPQRARATAVAVQMSRTPYTASCGSSLRWSNLFNEFDAFGEAHATCERFSGSLSRRDL